MAKCKAKWNDALAADLIRIEEVMSIAHIGNLYTVDLQNRTRNVYNQLGKSIKIGKIMQDMLLEYMTPAELKAKIDDRMLKIQAEELNG